jgi:hypothetical protein
MDWFSAAVLLLHRQVAAAVTAAVAGASGLEEQDGVGDYARIQVLSGHRLVPVLQARQMELRAQDASEALVRRRAVYAAEASSRPEEQQQLRRMVRQQPVIGLALAGDGLAEELVLRVELAEPGVQVSGLVKMTQDVSAVKLRRNPKGSLPALAGVERDIGRHSEVGRAQPEVQTAPAEPAVAEEKDIVLVLEHSFELAVRSVLVSEPATV